MSWRITPIPKVQYESISSRRLMCTLPNCSARRKGRSPDPSAKGWAASTSGSGYFVPRRDRRDRSLPAAQTAPRPARTGIRASGGKSHDPGKFPIDRSQQPRSSGGGKCESISRRLILPAGGFPIELPALRHRQRDIPKLVHHLVAEIARRAGKTITSVPKKTMDALMSWHWPGNVRELENFLERSAILTNGTVLAA